MKFFFINNFKFVGLIHFAQIFKFNIPSSLPTQKKWGDWRSFIKTDYIKKLFSSIKDLYRQSTNIL